jgi:hypothetical protein
MRDFTLQIYKALCVEFKNQGYKPLTFAAYCAMERPEKYIILRHDVDRNPHNALGMAMLENRLGINASYYFRLVPASYDRDAIKQIIDLDHEVGYHYEDISRMRGSMSKAIASFEDNLSALRELYPVKTICMHGSPLSKWDNRLLWRYYNYSDFGIIGEPYFDVDFDQVLYLTDTGRSWNSESTSIRDCVESQFNCSFSNTFDIIQSLGNGGLPAGVMLNVHPQRWHDRYLPWLKEFFWQNTKNIGKRILVTRR